MKKLLYILVFAGLIFTACENIHLEEPIYDFRTPETAFETEESTNAILLGMYKTMATHNYFGGIYHQLLTFNSSIMTRRAGGESDLARLEQTPGQIWIEVVYDAIYSAVAQANFIIASTDSSAALDYVQNARGQAYFFRAMNYFNLTRLFGPVPIVDFLPETPEEANVPRAESIDKMYELIISDLQEASSLLPEDQANALAPKQMAAKALLAKVYMTLASNKDDVNYWGMAKAYADTVIQSGIYTLEEDYADLWDITNEFTEESIVEFGFSNAAVGVGSSFTHYYVPQASGWSANGTGGWGRVVLTRELYDIIVNAHGGLDPRMENNVVYSYTRTDDQTVVSYPATSADGYHKYLPYPSVQKYKDPNGLDNNGHANNYIYLRLAEMYLIYAEAENELVGPTSDALWALNKVLERARTSGSSELPEEVFLGQYTNQDDFRDRIMVERYCELMGETHTWYDARRRGEAYFKMVCERHNARLDQAKDENAFKSASDFYFGTDDHLIKRNMLLPIPESEIAANEAIDYDDQNYGY